MLTFFPILERRTKALKVKFFKYLHHEVWGHYIVVPELQVAPLALDGSERDKNTL